MSNKDKPKIVEATGRAAGRSTAVAYSQTFARPPIHHPIYPLIGRIVSDWSHIEHLLDAIIWDLTRMIPSEGVCATSQMIGHGPRMFAITALLINLKLDRRVIEKSQTLHGQLRDASEKRNRFVHDAWYVEVNEGRPYQQKGLSRKDLKERGRSVPYELKLGIQDTNGQATAEVLLKEIQAAFMNVIAFHKAVRAALRA